MRGGNSHPAVQRANELVSAQVDGASLVTVPGAAHFLISTHAQDVASAIARHVAQAGGTSGRALSARSTMFEAAE